MNGYSTTIISCAFLRSSPNETNWFLKTNQFDLGKTVERKKETYNSHTHSVCVQGTDFAEIFHRLKTIFISIHRHKSISRDERKKRKILCSLIDRLTSVDVSSLSSFDPKVKLSRK